MTAAFAKRMRSRETRSGANPAFPTSFSIAAIGSIETSSSKSKRARILRCCKLFAQRVDVRSRIQEHKHAQAADHIVKDPPAVRPFFPCDLSGSARPHRFHLLHDCAA